MSMLSTSRVHVNDGDVHDGKECDEVDETFDWLLVLYDFGKSGPDKIQ